jgi:hypothetical protein
MIRAIHASCENRSPAPGLSLFWMTVVRLTAFLMFFQGLPLAWFLPQEAEAFQIKRVVRRANVSFASGTEALQDDLSSAGSGNLLQTPVVELDMTKSFIISSSMVDEADAQSNLRNTVSFISVIDDPKTVLLSRRSSAANAWVDYTVIEAEAGMSVVSGITVMPEGTASPQTKTIALPSDLDLTKSFPMVTVRAWTAASGTDERNIFSAQLADAGAYTSLTFKRSETASQYNADIAYQVITFDDDVCVQAGVLTMGGDNNTTMDTATVTLTDAANTACDGNKIVDAAKSVLFFTADGGTSIGGIETDYLISGDVTSNNTLTFRLEDSSTTTGASEQMSVKWYLVEFSNKSYAQVGRLIDFDNNSTGETGSTHVCSGTVNANTCDVTISSVAPSQAFVAHSTSISTTTASTSNAQLADGMVRAQLSSGTQLQLRRNGTPDLEAEVAFHVVEFPPVDVTYPNGDAGGTQVFQVGDQVDVQWDHADGPLDGNADPTYFDDNREIAVSKNAGTFNAVTCDTPDDASPLTFLLGEDDNDCGVTTTDPNKGCCTWTIPGEVSGTNLVSTLLKLRVSDTTIGSCASARS